jgi:hypothetical protein
MPNPTSLLADALGRNLPETSSIARGETQLFVREVKLGAARYSCAATRPRRNGSATSGRRSSPGSANSSRAATKR